MILKIQENSKQSKLAPLYFVGSFEPFLLQETGDSVRKELKANGFIDHTVLQVDAHFDWHHTLTQKAALTLFESKSLIELRCAQAPSEAGLRILNTYISQQIQAASTSNQSLNQIVLILCEKPTAHLKKSSGFQALSKIAKVMMPTLSKKQWPFWIRDRVSRAGLILTQEALDCLTRWTEGNPSAAVQTIEKLRLMYPTGLTGNKDEVEVKACSRHGLPPARQILSEKRSDLEGREYGRRVQHRSPGSNAEFGPELTISRMSSPKEEIESHITIQASQMIEILEDQAQFELFNLTEAIFEGKTSRCMRILERLRYKHIEPSLVLWIIARDLRTLALMLYSKESGQTESAYLQKHTISQYESLRFQRVLHAYNVKDLLEYFSLAHQVDRVIKGVDCGNPWIALQSLCLTLAEVNKKVH